MFNLIEVSTTGSKLCSVKFAHSPILHYAFSSWIEKTMKKTIHRHWENRFVLESYGVMWKFYRLFFEGSRRSEARIIFSLRRHCL